MPKGKRKTKGDRSGRTEIQTDDSDSTFDGASVVSGYSDTHSVVEEGSSDPEDSTVEEEDKLIEIIDGLTQKSAQGRTQCFDALSKGLVRKYVPDFVFDRRLTLLDSIERSLKRSSCELSSAAGLLPLLCVQLGSGEASESLYQTLRPHLTALSADASAAAPARAKCCVSLALSAFLASGALGEVLELMEHLERVFQGSYLKGDGQQPIISQPLASLHASAINSWNLLLTLMSPGDVYQLWGPSGAVSPSLDQLFGLLESPHLEVRLAAGESFALLYELGRIFHEDFAEDFTPNLVDALKMLATDSHKYRAKKERKQQRATFRDILHYIEEDTFPDIQVRFGQEALILDSWTKRRQYDALCQTLGPGLNLHLAENELLRDIFGLGARLVKLDTQGAKQTKLERHLMNAANFKARTISRSKNRDKRSAVLAC